MNALYKISPLFCLFTHFTSIQALNDFKEKHKINMAHVFQEINNRETLKNALKVKIINGLSVINKKFDYEEEESEDEESQNDFKEKHKINMAHVFQEINNPETLNNTLKVKIINGISVINKKFDYVEEESEDEESEDEEDLITYCQNSTKQEDFYASDQLIKDDKDQAEDSYEENYNNKNDNLSDEHETTKKTSTAGTALWCITLIAWFMKSSH